MKGVNGIKRHTGTIAIVELVIIIGLVTSTAILAASKSHTSPAQLSSQQASDTTQTASSSYKLSACKSGTTQTIANAEYVVGTDIAPGSYKITALTGTAGDSYITEYMDKQAFTSQNLDQNEASAEQSFSPNDGTSTYTRLSDGQYMIISDDPATFTCQ
jgi:hypothetical protein